MYCAKIRILIITSVVCIVFPRSVNAQNVGDVSSPDVQAGKGHISVRSGVRPASDSRRDASALRLHVQWAPTEALHWRVGMLANQTDDNSLRFATVFGEINWQTHEDQEAGFDSALRIDLQLADTDQARNRVRASWLAQRTVWEDWQIRTNVGISQQFGTGANTVAGFSGGAMLSRVLVGQQRLGIETLGDTTSKTLSAGPVASGPIVGPWSYQMAASFGLTEQTAPVEYRLFLVWGF